MVKKLLVDHEHKAVKVQSDIFFRAEALAEEVHYHGLSASYRSPNIGAWYLGGLIKSVIKPALLL